MADANARQNPRASLGLTVWFRRAEADAALEKAGRVHDLGTGGAYIESERPPPIGTSIVLRLEAPSAWDPLELPAEVRWLRDEAPTHGFGVSFRDLTEQQVALLSDLVRAAGYESEFDRAD